MSFTKRKRESERVIQSYTDRLGFKFEDVRGKIDELIEDF